MTEQEALTAILGELRRQRVPDDAWTAEDIADYVKLEKSTVQGQLIKAPGFPTPRRLPTGGKRWDSREVRTWWNRQPRATPNA